MSKHKLLYKLYPYISFPAFILRCFERVRQCENY